MTVEEILAEKSRSLSGLSLQEIRAEQRRELDARLAQQEEEDRALIESQGRDPNEVMRNAQVAALKVQALAPLLVLGISDPKKAEGFNDWLREQGLPSTLSPGERRYHFERFRSQGAAE